MGLGSKGDNSELTLINGLVLIRTVGKTQKQNIFQFTHFISTAPVRRKHQVLLKASQHHPNSFDILTKSGGFTKY